MNKFIEFMLMTVITVSVVYLPTAKGDKHDTIIAEVTTFFEKLDNIFNIQQSRTSAIFPTKMQKTPFSAKKGENSSKRRKTSSNLEYIKTQANVIFRNRFRQKIRNPEAHGWVPTWAFIAYHEYRKKLLYEERIPASDLPLLSAVEFLFDGGVRMRMEMSRLLVFELENIIGKLDLICEKPAGNAGNEERKIAGDFLECAKLKGFDVGSKELLPVFENAQQFLDKDLNICAQQTLEAACPIEKDRIFNLAEIAEEKRADIFDTFIRYHNEFEMWNPDIRQELPFYTDVNSLVAENPQLIPTANAFRYLNEF